MRCANCGAAVNPNSRFCDQCAAPIGDPEETRIARPQASVPAQYGHDDDETVIFSVRPTLLFIKIGYATAIIAAILVTIVLAMIRFVDIPLYISLPVPLTLLLLP